MLLIDKLNGAEDERLNELKSIYTTIGRCQLRLNREAEAEESFKKASEYVKRLVGQENGMIHLTCTSKKPTFAADNIPKRY